VTTYMAAYDVEAGDCLEALRTIIPLHERFEMPATLFIVARLLDEQGDGYRELLTDHPLVEIASHSYTHMLLRDHAMCGPAGPPDQYRHELVDSKKRLEEHFGCEVSGFRAPCCFEDGFHGAPHLLELCREAGYAHIGTLAWAPGCKLPALIRDPFNYADDGYPELWEIPPCGWHDNVMKKGNCAFGPDAVQISPHPYPETKLDGFIESPEAEAELNAKFIDRAIRMNARHVSLIWHPWSLRRFDPEMRMLERTFECVKELSLPVSTYADYARTL